MGEHDEVIARFFAAEIVDWGSLDGRRVLRIVDELIDVLLGRYRYSLDYDQRQDLAQIVRIEVHGNAAQVRARTRGQLGSLCRKAMFYEFLDMVRRRRPERPIEPEEGEHDPARAGRGQDPEGLVLDRMHYERVLECIRRCSERGYRFIQLELSCLTPDEICAELAVTRATLYQIRHRTRELFQQCQERLSDPGQSPRQEGEEP